MQRTYPKRYAKPDANRYTGLIAEQLGLPAAEVVLAGEMNSSAADFIFVDDASAFPIALTGDPRYTCPFLSLRADVLYVDEELGIVRFNGPVGGYRRGETSRIYRKAAPLPELLRQTGIEPGVWLAISGYRGEDFSVTLLRVTEALLQRGNGLSREPERTWSQPEA